MDDTSPKHKGTRAPVALTSLSQASSKYEATVCEVTVSPAKMSDVTRAQVTVTSTAAGARQGSRCSSVLVVYWWCEADASVVMGYAGTRAARESSSSVSNNSVEYACDEGRTVTVTLTAVRVCVLMRQSQAVAWCVG